MKNNYIKINMINNKSHAKNNYYVTKFKTV